MVMSNEAPSDSYKKPSARKGGANPNIKEQAKKHSLPEVSYRVFSEIKPVPVKWLVDGMLQKEPTLSSLETLQ